MLGLLAFAITGSGGAAVATSLHGRSARELGLSIGNQVRVDTVVHDAVCRPDDVRTQPRTVVSDDLQVYPAIAQRFPVLAIPAPPAELARATAIIERSSARGGGVVARTSIHLVHADAHRDLLLYVSARDTMATAHEPAACRALRHTLVAERTRGRSPAVIAAAEELVDRSFDTQVGAQLLTVGMVPRAHPLKSWGAVGMLVQRDRAAQPDPLPSGMVGSFGPTYVGFASSGAVRLRLRAVHPELAPGLPSSIEVVDGFWVLHLRGSTGRVDLTEVDAAGVTLGRYHVR